MSNRTIEQIAVDVLKCATSHVTDVRLIGNVQAIELARLAERHITSCPSCGSEPWVNIDCHLCSAMSEVRKLDE